MISLSGKEYFAAHSHGVCAKVISKADLSNFEYINTLTFISPADSLRVISEEYILLSLKLIVLFFKRRTIYYQ
ncbi:hypothetical protein Mucpa_2769 [Mucilaginibacter paludis DSM 18603]|uniref:Uncharacterized protein n=1 Tax=Mucilaginibacter paludis DSM 18603 TaxID=714943 RepID=H1Y8K9_9SPHI|nr:hypothetical protein Mucpa_2769 [Mucilaginibacter paludis DSM 18603]